MRSERRFRPVRAIKRIFHSLGLNHYFVQERIARRGNTVAYMFGILFLFLSLSMPAPRWAIWGRSERTAECQTWPRSCLYSPCGLAVWSS